MAILIVDDSSVDLMLLKTNLKKVGYLDIFTAESALEAIGMLTKSNGNPSSEIDLILMDIDLPGMSGIEACRQIKLTEGLKDIPVIIVTGKDDISYYKLALSAGALDYIQKPVNEAELLARVHSALKMKYETALRKARERELEDANRLLKSEREKAEKLLYNIIPVKIAKKLKYRGEAEPVLYKGVTVFLSDIVGFTELCALLDPDSLIEELNDIFTVFDDIMEKNHCERITTIGDAYLAVCGIPDKNPAHAENIVHSAIEIVEYLKQRNKKSVIQWKTRIGIHTGDVIGSVVGVRKFLFDIFGDTMKVVWKMEESADPLGIMVSGTTCGLVKDMFSFEERSHLTIPALGRVNRFAVSYDGNA